MCYILNKWVDLNFEFIVQHNLNHETGKYPSVFDPLP